ncbi:hypothetical protein BJV82DRAFT_222570 [Fennellomyces sp. T-0311]|nr:hypothetical protein BJV82DRAFT_222570 [Fennellomyces sp. T-0311]
MHRLRGLPHGIHSKRALGASHEVSETKRHHDKQQCKLNSCARKHTGEKPFKCIVPGCERMFSRFDNMMQHTQTHNKSRSARRSKGTKGPGKKPVEDQQHHYPGMPSPPPSRRSSIQSNLAGRRRFSDDEDDDDDEYNEADEDSDASYHPPANKRNPSVKEQRAMMAQLRRLSQEEASMTYPHHYQQPFYYPTWHSTWPPPPPPAQGVHPLHPPPIPLMPTAVPPESPPSPTESADLTDYSSSSSYRRRRSSHRVTPQVHFHPYPRKYYSDDDDEDDEEEEYRRNSQDFLAGQMILPRLASYLVKHPGESPESYLLHHSPPSSPKTRRLSVQDLCNPIESLEPTATPDQENGVDLTEDEFQALQGFGRFRLVAIASSDSSKAD